MHSNLAFFHVQIVVLSSLSRRISGKCVQVSFGFELKLEIYSHMDNFNAALLKTSVRKSISKN